MNTIYLLDQCIKKKVSDNNAKEFTQLANRSSASYERQPGSY